MSTVSAMLVKELRERTGLGMMECKKALQQVNGDVEKAIDELRKSGQARAAKKAGRTAAEGVVLTKVSSDRSYGVIVEVNSETDFVARDEGFVLFANKVLDAVYEQKQTDVAVIMQGELETARLELVQKIGENITVRRANVLQGGVVGSYIHGNKKIAVLVSQASGDPELSYNVAMHVAAVNPQVVNKEDMPKDLIEKEKAIFVAQAEQSGKPASIIEKMVFGRINKFLAESSLVEQAFVKDPEVKVGDLAKKYDTSIENFIRFEVGEGIAKKELDFAAEVAAATASAQS